MRKCKYCRKLITQSEFTACYLINGENCGYRFQIKDDTENKQEFKVDH